MVRPVHVICPSHVSRYREEIYSRACESASIKVAKKRKFDVIKNDVTDEPSRMRVHPLKLPIVFEDIATVYTEK